MNLLKTLLIVLLMIAGYTSYGQWYDWQVRVTQTDSALVEFSKTMDEHGYMPANINGFYYQDQIRFSTIWEKYPEPSKWEFQVNMTFANLNDKMNEMSDKGLSPIDLSNYVKDGQVMYACIWAAALEVRWQAWSDLTPRQFQERSDTLVAYEFTMTDINGYEINGESFYTGIWKKYSSGPWKYVYGNNEEEFKNNVVTLKKEGYVPYDMSVYMMNGQPYYSAIWMQSDQEAFFVVFGNDITTFQETLDKQIAAGFAMTDFDGYTVFDKTFFSAIFKKVISVEKR